VVKWRNRSVAAQSATEQMEASAGLNKSLMDFFVLSEQYPDLKANANFLSLQNDLKDIEGKLNQSRRYYNGTVRNFNQVISIFPNNLVAGAFNFAPEPFFQEEAGAAANPAVKFS
jgi:LemA protein